MGLIEERHPAFKRLMRLWREAQVSDAPPSARDLGRSALADLAAVTVTLVCDDADVRIAESGDAVDALYRAELGGASADRLTPKCGGAADEALAASRSGRPLLIEDELLGPRAAHRPALPAAQQRRRLAGRRVMRGCRYRLTADYSFLN